MREICTYACTDCGHTWTAPQLKTPPKCPKCHGAHVFERDARLEKAPLQ